MDDIENQVALFKSFREELLRRLGQQEEEIKSSLAKTRDARRDVSGHGQRGSASAPGEGTQGDRVLAWIRATPGRHTAQEIADATGIARTSLGQVLLALVGAGLIERPARGLYQAPAPKLLPAHQEPQEAEEPPAESARAAEHIVAEPPKRETPADRMRRVQRARGERG